jgi:hypothetical protein
MSWWFNLALLAVFVLLLTAMPWNRPHPNHILALELVTLLSDDDSEPQSRGIKGSARQPQTRRSRSVMALGNIGFLI